MALPRLVCGLDCLYSVCLSLVAVSFVSIFCHFFGVVADVDVAVYEFDIYIIKPIIDRLLLGKVNSTAAAKWFHKVCMFRDDRKDMFEGIELTPGVSEWCMYLFNSHRLH